MRSLLVMMRGAEPFALAIQRFLEPLRSLTNAMCLASGEMSPEHDRLAQGQVVGQQLALPERRACELHTPLLTCTV